MVHPVDISLTDEPQKPDSGVVHHVAFVSHGFDGMKQRLQSKGMEFESHQVPGGDLWQIFVHDPNGVMIELNYEAAREQGGGPPWKSGATISAGSRNAERLRRSSKRWAPIRYMRRTATFC